MSGGLILTMLASASLASFAGSVRAQEPDPVSTRMSGIDGADIGAIAARPAASGGVLLDLNLQNLPAGALLAFHIHENGACDAADGFESAGGHFAPQRHDHGYFSENGFHAGDMPNILVSDAGTIRGQVFNANVSLRESADDSAIGKAIIIHDGFDDYSSQPSGDAGNRIACGLIGR